jgi:hypothetical protein
MCLAGEDQEGGLEGVVGVVAVAENAPANAKHHRPVAADQARKGGLVSAGQEALHKLAVVQHRLVASGQAVAQTAHHRG